MEVNGHLYAPVAFPTGKGASCTHWKRRLGGHKDLCLSRQRIEHRFSGHAACGMYSHYSDWATNCLSLLMDAIFVGWKIQSLQFPLPSPPITALSLKGLWVGIFLPSCGARGWKKTAFDLQIVGTWERRDGKMASSPFCIKKQTHLSRTLGQHQKEGEAVSINRKLKHHTELQDASHSNAHWERRGDRLWSQLLYRSC